MADLVTLQEAKDYCAIDSDYFDGIVAILIAAASEAVRDVATDWDGTGPVPDRLKLAVLTRVAIAFDNRESVEPGKGELAMLTPLRKLEV